MKTVAIIRIFLVAVIGYFFLNWVGTTGETSIFIEEPWLWAFYGFIVLFYIAVEICIQALESVLYRTLSPENQKSYNEKAAFAKANQFKWFKETYKKLLGSKPIEEEGEIILDHNYDGIRELDNKLPPWWVYGFYVTILFAIIYMARFQFLVALTKLRNMNWQSRKPKLKLRNIKNCKRPCGCQHRRVAYRCWGPQYR